DQHFNSRFLVHNAIIFQSLPQSDPDEDERNSSQWRITVNPSANFFSTSDELKSLINKLYRTQKLITPSEAKYLCTALKCIDISSDILLPLLTVISNATAYTANQYLFAQFGITEKVAAMMKNYHVMLLQCIANMAACRENTEILQQTIPLVVKRLNSSVDMERTVAFQALTNLSYTITRSQVETILPAIPICLKRLWEKGEANINSLRLLVNLSCCPDMVPHILAAKTVTGLLSILDTDKPEILLRAITWLLCMSSAVHALSLTYEVIAPLNQDPFANPNYTIYFSIYAPKGRQELIKRLNSIAMGNDETALKAKRLLETLGKIPEARSLLSNLNRL
uniref:Arm_2 domain-containing protein n=1 Tax=Elaeophora elaphi TaxID=1147741 RepID=A0A0R3S1K3_9BILA